MNRVVGIVCPPHRAAGDPPFKGHHPPLAGRHHGIAVRRGPDTRRLTASGRDIYAVTAPIIVEGVVRLLDGRSRGYGAAAPGEIFDASDVLSALAKHPGGLDLR